MIEFNTERLIAKSDVQIVNSELITANSNNAVIDLLKLERTTGRESGFVFYDKNKTDIKICHIGFLRKRGKFELSFGTEIEYRRMGYMYEALVNTIDWLFKHTNENIIWAIPGNYASEKLLKKCGFKKSTSEQINEFKWYALTKDDTKSANNGGPQHGKKGKQPNGC